MQLTDVIRRLLGKAFGKLTVSDKGKERAFTKANRILVVTHVRFWVPDRGSVKRVAGMFAALKDFGYEIHVVHTDPLLAADQVAVKNMGVESIVSRPCDTSCISSPIQGYDAALRKTVEERHRALQPSLLLIEYARFSPVTSRIGKEVIKIVDTHDVAHLMAESFERNGESVFFRVSPEQEKNLLEPFDIIIAIQDQDAQVFSQLLPEKKVVTCLPSIDIPTGSETNFKTDKDPEIIFVGCSSRPNVCGLEHFVIHSWPEVLQSHPRARLKVFGSVCDPFKEKAFQNVDFVGFTPNIEEVYRSADIVISPVFFGGGMKIKCAEAMSYAKACVVSPHSAIGMDDGRGSAYWVADHPDDFQAIITRLLSDSEERIRTARAAREYAISHFSSEVTIKPLLKALRELGVLTPGRPDKCN